MSCALFSFYNDFKSAFSGGRSKIRGTFCIATPPSLSGQPGLQIMTWDGKAQLKTTDMLQLPKLPAHGPFVQYFLLSSLKKGGKNISRGESIWMAGSCPHPHPWRPGAYANVSMLGLGLVLETGPRKCSPEKVSVPSAAFSMPWELLKTRHNFHCCYSFYEVFVSSPVIAYYFLLSFSKT